MTQSRIVEDSISGTPGAYDLRIYDVADGELTTLERVMREVVLPMMPEYGITACGVWTDSSSSTLYQISRHASQEVIHENWDRFHADSRWQTRLREIRQDRVVVKGVRTVVLSSLPGLPPQASLEA